MAVTAATQVNAGSVATVARTALTPMVWGTTYIVATELLPAGRPMLAATVRALPVGLAFVLWSRRLPHGIWWWRSALLGLLNIGAFFALLFVAAFRLPGGVAATAGAIQPLVAASIAAVLIGEAFTRKTALAGLMGIGGVAMLVLGPEARLDPIGIAAAIGGTVCMAAGVVLTKMWGRPVDLITFTGWQLSVGGLLLLPLALITEGLPDEVTGANLAGFAWLAIVGTGAAYANWFNGVQRLPVSVVSFLGLLSPLVATILGWMILDQALTPVQMLGGALVITAIVIPQLRHRATRVSMTLDGQIDAVVQLAASLTGDVVLVGHSGGGAVVQGVTDRVPELIRRVIYVDSGPLIDGASLMPGAVEDIPLPSWDELAQQNSSIDGMDADSLATFRAEAVDQPAAVAGARIRVTNPPNG